MRYWAIASCGSLVALTACTSREPVSQDIPSPSPTPDEESTIFSRKDSVRPTPSQSVAAPETEVSERSQTAPSRETSALLQARLQQIRAQRTSRLPQLQPGPSFSAAATRASLPTISTAAIASDRQAIQARIQRLAQQNNTSPTPTARPAAATPAIQPPRATVRPAELPPLPTPASYRVTAVADLPQPVATHSPEAVSNNAADLTALSVGAQPLPASRPLAASSPSTTHRSEVATAQPQGLRLNGIENASSASSAVDPLEAPANQRTAANRHISTVVSARLANTPAPVAPTPAPPTTRSTALDEAAVSTTDQERPAAAEHLSTGAQLPLSAEAIAHLEAQKQPIQPQFSATGAALHATALQLVSAASTTTPPETAQQRVAVNAAGHPNSLPLTQNRAVRLPVQSVQERTAPVAAAEPAEATPAATPPVAQPVADQPTEMQTSSPSAAGAPAATAHQTTAAEASIPLEVIPPAAPTADAPSAATTHQSQAEPTPAASVEAAEGVPASATTVPSAAPKVTLSELSLGDAASRGKLPQGTPAIKTPGSLGFETPVVNPASTVDTPATSSVDGEAALEDPQASLCLRQELARLSVNFEQLIAGDAPSPEAESAAEEVCNQEANLLAHRIPEAAAAGTPIPGRVESPTL